MASLTTGPLVPLSILTPNLLDNSFSGINPTDNNTVSHSYISSVPGIVLLFSSVFTTTTDSTLSFPLIFTIL